jgi:hypothetical protein
VSRRWLALAVSLAAAAAALYALATAPRTRTAAPPAGGEIGEASRAELERVLRDAEAEEEGDR